MKSYNIHAKNRLPKELHTNRIKNNLSGKTFVKLKVLYRCEPPKQYSNKKDIWYKSNRKYAR